MTMNEKLTDLVQRRQKLIRKAASQRIVLAQNMASLRQPIAMADRGYQIVRYFRQYPILMLGISAVSTLLIRRLHMTRFNALLQTGWSVFQLVKDVRESIRKN